MTKLTKKQKALQGKVDSTKLYALNEALGIVKEAATAKFDESIDVAVQLGIDPKKSDQVVRGAVVMPNGTGKTKRVAVFAQGAKAEEAKAAGADIVGMDDLAARVKAGEMPFDVVIAAPDAMRVVGTLGQILGPRGLMPNPKVGTVTPDVATAVKNAKAGQVQFRADKAGHHARHDRPPLVRVGQAAGQPGGADGSAEQGQAGHEQRCVFEERLRFRRPWVWVSAWTPRRCRRKREGKLAGHARRADVVGRRGPAKESGGPSKTVGAQGMRLIDGLEVRLTAQANADGDPAADGIERFPRTVGRCNEACPRVQARRHIEKE